MEEVQTAMDNDGNIVDADEIEAAFTETRFSGWDLLEDRFELGDCVAALVICEVKDIGEKTGKGGEQVFYQKLKAKQIESVELRQITEVE